MSEAKEIVEKIYSLEEEINRLRREYALIVPPCQNKDCGYYNERHENHCSWTWYVGECPDYRAE